MDRAADYICGALHAFRACRDYSLVLIIAVRRYSLRLPPAAFSKSSAEIPSSAAAPSFGYSLVELFERAQFRIDVGLSPTFEELNCSFGHGYSPGARLLCRRPLLSGRSRPCSKFELALCRKEIHTHSLLLVHRASSASSAALTNFGVARTRADRLSRPADLMQRASQLNSAAILAALL